MTAPPKFPLRIIRRKQLEERTGLSRSSIYDRLSVSSPRFDPSFPRAIQLGPKAVGWVEAEIDAWLLNRMQMNRV
ncbi:AlpA family phage regulatory protein [Rugamonas rivuli]|uniref:AlpA family phage regulatory protein n=1 Tax=Rugamonas rivuli TaxID=2743358 RepID=A0A843SGD4_9BURK|nr:AlpA family phage regulatory protein [Rugamonas rivuli]MQA21528.1 AlpA family phage regulatory protein [Rugamonas rivuli]